jgi:hypothetical protein
MFDDADKFLKIAVGLGVLAAGAGIGYHYAVYLPKTEQQKIERAAQKEAQMVAEKEAKSAKYESCTTRALGSFLSGWEKSCKQLGKGKDCSLPIGLAESWEETLKTDKQACLDEFKSGI